MLSLGVLAGLLIVMQFPTASIETVKAPDAATGGAAATGAATTPPAGVSWSARISANAFVPVLVALTAVLQCRRTVENSMERRVGSVVSILFMAAALVQLIVGLVSDTREALPSTDTNEPCRYTLSGSSNQIDKFSCAGIKMGLIDPPLSSTAVNEDDVNDGLDSVDTSIRLVLQTVVWVATVFAGLMVAWSVVHLLGKEDEYAKRVGDSSLVQSAYDVSEGAAGMVHSGYEAAAGAGKSVHKGATAAVGSVVAAGAAAQQKLSAAHQKAIDATDSARAHLAIRKSDALKKQKEANRAAEAQAKKDEHAAALAKIKAGRAAG